jgi:hypothetical protein
MSAVISECTLFRYLLERIVADAGITIAFFGVNGATADADLEDHTTIKWREFTIQNKGRRYLAANPFAYRATDVHELARVDDPIGPENSRYLDLAIAEADLLVPCWGSRTKLPKRLRPELDKLRERVFASGKPVKIFGLTQSGDPKHPLMLGYDTPLVDWRNPQTSGLFADLGI